MRRLPVILGLVLIAAMISVTAAGTIIASQGMSGREGAGLLLLGYGGGWFLLFGIGPALLMLFSATGRRSFLAAFVAFGVGGGVSGGLIAILFVARLDLGGAVMIVFAIPFTLPWILGAVVLKVSYLDARRISPEVFARKILEELGRPIILSKANTLPPPHSPSLSGEVAFDYSSHDGRFEFGHGDLGFESRWTRASNRSIYCYNDAPSIRGVAVAPVGVDFSSLGDVATLDFTSRTRCPAVGQFVVLQNTKGFFALLRIESIGDMTRGDHSDQLRLRYWIRPDGGSDFSNEKG